MLLKNTEIYFNDDELRQTLKDLVKKQIDYIKNQKILGLKPLNKIINKINKKYEMQIEQFEEKKSDSLDKISLEFIIFGEDSNEPDIEYLLRFI